MSSILLAITQCNFHLENKSANGVPGSVQKSTSLVQPSSCQQEKMAEIYFPKNVTEAIALTNFLSLNLNLNSVLCSHKWFVYYNL